MGLKERSHRARVLYDTGSVTSRGGNGVARTIVMPGRKARLHLVILKWPGGKGDRPQGEVETECHVMSGKQTVERCKGSLAGVCYHVMAGVNLAMAERGYVTGWSESAPAARRLKNLHQGAVAFRVTGQGGRSLYVTAWPEKEKVVEAVKAVDVLA